MPHMTTYGDQMDRKWTGSGPEVSSNLPSVRPEVDRKCPSVCLSVPNTSLTSLMNIMRGNYKRRALAPCDFLI